MTLALSEGKFVLEERQFFNNGKKFCIKERKKGVEKKPKHYLIAIPFEYVSSLFPISREGREGIEAYHFDYQQELWELEIRGEVGSLKKVEPV